MDSGGSSLTLLRMTTRNLYRRPMRTSLTALGVAVGVVAIVAFTTIVRGLWDAVDASIHINDAELLIFQADIAADFLSTLDEKETRAKLTAITGVENAVGTLWHALPVENHLLFFILGLRLEDMGSGGDNLIRGRYPTSDDEVLLGAVAQRVLDKDVDNTLHIRDEPYRIVGIFQSESVFIDGAIVINLPRLQRLAAKEGSVTVFQVHVDPDKNADAVGEEIERRYPELIAVGEASEYHKVDQGLVAVDGMVWAVSFMAIVIGSIIVANTMWMSVLERTREIGVLRAVGWSRRRIVSMIILEAAGVGFIAVLLGCPAGVGLAKLSASMPVAEQFLEPVFDTGPFLLALAIAIVLSVFGALLPAWRAARISPAEALRYE